MRRVVSLCLAAALSAGAHAAAPPGNATPSEDYSALLREVVHKIPVNERAFETRVDYERVAADSLRVGQILRFMRDGDPASLTPTQRQVWAVNLYNLTILDILSRHYQTVDSISEIGDENFSIFDKPLIEVAGTTYSLNELERSFLFDAEDGNPQLHFAVVCGAKGCPALWPEPLRDDTLHQQLEAMVLNALHNPRHLWVRPDGVQASAVFDWYLDDFGGHSGVREFILRYRPDLSDAPILEPGLEWDWSLNIVP